MVDKQSGFISFLFNKKYMCTFPQEEIELLNNLIHKIIGVGSIEIINRNFLGADLLKKEISSGLFSDITKQESLLQIKNLSDENYLSLYKIINFYYPRWVAFNVIKDSDDVNAKFSSNNELLLALTSIIDCLANTKNERMGWTLRFVNFISNNLSQSDVDVFIGSSMVYKGKTRIQLTSLDDFARYIYEVRSLIVHNSELGGMYPYGVDFNIDYQTNVIDSVMMIRPDIFRRFLWKAIFNSLGLRIIY